MSFRLSSTSYRLSMRYYSMPSYGTFFDGHPPLPISLWRFSYLFAIFSFLLSNPFKIPVL